MEVYPDMCKTAAHPERRWYITHHLQDDFSTDHEELPLNPYPATAQTSEEGPSTPLLSWPAAPTETPVINEESVAPHEPERRDDTSEEWSDEVHRQSQAWTRMETEVRDKATTQFLACVQRMGVRRSATGESEP